MECSNALSEALREGQQRADFRADFNAQVMANAINGAVGAYLLNPTLKATVSLEAYSAELVRTFDRAITAG